MIKNKFALEYLVNCNVSLKLYLHFRYNKWLVFVSILVFILPVFLSYNVKEKSRKNADKCN